jgi:hypothetical protein
VSTDTNNPNDQPQADPPLTYRDNVVNFAKAVAGGPVIGLIVGTVFLLTGVPRGTDHGFEVSDTLFQWYFIPYVIAFAGSAFPFVRYLRARVDKHAGLLAWSVELLRVALVIIWLSMVFSLHAGAVVWSAASLVVLVLLAAAFKSGVNYCSKHGAHKVLPAA